MGRAHIPDRNLVVLARLIREKLEVGEKWETASA